MQRNRRAALAEETLEILKVGSYQSPEGQTITIARDLATAVRHTKLYCPNEFPAELTPVSPGKSLPPFEMT